MKIGITGATGQLGRLVVEKLKERIADEHLVALVRSPEKATDLGVEARAFDYGKAETLVEPLRGIDKLLFISASEIGRRTPLHKNVINAAQEAGVQWIVYTSLLHADTSSLGLAEEHVETEKILKASGIPHTILRNGWYTENYLGSIAGAIASGALMGSAGEGKISSATREDYAEAAAVVITSEGHQGKVYELAGDEAFTLSELAAEISLQTGKDIPYKDLPEEEYVSALKSLDIPEGFAQTLAGWDIGISKNDLFNNSKTLSKLIGHPTTPMAETVKKALAHS
jgi:NAD(P)H dehydrogenase (quinone)